MSDEPIELDTPWRRDPDELASRLTEWARAVIAPDVTVCEAIAPGNGMSSETVLFDLTRRRRADRALRRPRSHRCPEVYPVFPEYDLELQSEVHEARARAHRRARARGAVGSSSTRSGSARRSS